MSSRVYTDPLHVIPTGKVYRATGSVLAISFIFLIELQSIVKKTGVSIYEQTRTCVSYIKLQIYS